MIHKKYTSFINEGLDEDKIKKIRSVYNNLMVMKDPKDSGIVGWRTHENQRVRFDQLVKYIKSGDAILDYGCGVGDLSKYLKDKYEVDYIGIDINENMIKAAKGKYPDSDFHAMDSAFDFEKYDYDWFIASGVFSNYMTEEEMLSVIKPAFNKSRKGLAINFLISDNISKFNGSPETDGYLRGYDPKKLYKLFKDITPNVEVITGYASDDFTIILKK